MALEFDPAVLGKQAYQFLYRIVTEVGPRPAGQEGETRAAALIADLLSGWGYTVERHPFAFAPQPRFFPYYTLLAAAFLAGSLLLVVFPWLCLFLPLLAGTLPLVSDWLLARLPRSARSANLTALPRGCDLSQVDLLFCAHLDTARAMPFRSSFLHGLSRQIDNAALRLGLILASVAAFPIFGILLPPAIHLAAISVTVLTALVFVGLDLWQQLGEGGRYTPGVSDNASGLGVLLAIAELLAAQPPDRLRVGFLFTAAEECGLYGSQRFAAQLKKQFLRPNVVNLDMVGSGDALRLIIASGAVFPAHTNAALNDWIERAEPEVRRLEFTRRTSDFVSFLKQGIPAAGLESNGTPRFWRAYHTLQDGLALADEAMLARTAGAMARLVVLLDRDKRD